MKTVTTCSALLILATLCGQAAAGVVAATGFNDASGIHSDAAANSPYALNSTISGQGAGEVGWLGTWAVLSGPIANATVQDEITKEGDGALYLQRTTNTRRRWADPQSGVFVVEQHLRFTENSRTVIYLFDGSLGGLPNGAQGPVWAAFPDGSVVVIDGTGDGCFSCPTEDTGFDWTPDRWHKFTTIVDVPENTYRFFMDDVEYLAPDPLGFRGTPSAIDAINYLAEVSGNGTYVDSIRVIPEPATSVLACLAVVLSGCAWRARNGSRRHAGQHNKDPRLLSRPL